MARDYDPTSGRYVEGDPIGLGGGSYSTYAYANENPIDSIDALGLAVEGSWITPPQLHLTGIQITNARPTLSINWWGKIGLVNLYGNVEGYVNIDVRCKEGCRNWEVHNRLNLAAYGHYTLGPNVFATIIGLRAGAVGAAGANVAINGASALYTLYNLLNNRAAPLLRALASEGPSAICLSQSPP